MIRSQPDGCLFIITRSVVDAPRTGRLVGVTTKKKSVEKAVIDLGFT
jgi:ribosomal protein L18